jgi:hypothetical protein
MLFRRVVVFGSLYQFACGDATTHKLHQDTETVYVPWNGQAPLPIMMGQAPMSLLGQASISCPT